MISRIQMIALVSFFFISLSPAAALAAPIKVVTSTTDLAWVAKQIGLEHVEVTALLKGTENPHFVDAVPDYIRLAAEANVVCQVGLDLEVGWMPKVLARSGNAAVQPGGKGFCEAGRGISVLEKPVGAIDRSMGDVHPSGNPHFWLGPDALIQSATVVRDTLVANDPAHAAAYKAGFDTMKQTVEAVKARNAAKLKVALAGHQGAALIEYHKEFTYFLQSFGLTSLGSIEEKPGVTPSAGRLADMASSAKGAGLKFILAGDTAPRRTISKFAELSGLPVVIVPLSVKTAGKPGTYPELIDYIVDQIVLALHAKKG